MPDCPTPDRDTVKRAAHALMYDRRRPLDPDAVLAAWRAGPGRAIAEFFRTAVPRRVGMPAVLAAPYKGSAAPQGDVYAAYAADTALTPARAADTWRSLAFNPDGSTRPVDASLHNSLALDDLTERLFTATAALDRILIEAERAPDARWWAHQALVEIGDLGPDETDVNAPAPASYQARVAAWCRACFPDAQMPAVRAQRFVEEALELAQAVGMTAAEAHMLVRYTWGRPAGDAGQELGGATLTLAALATALQLDHAQAAEQELTRVEGLIDRIRAKQAAKDQARGPLPGGAAADPLAAFAQKVSDIWANTEDEGDLVTQVGAALRDLKAAMPA